MITLFVDANAQKLWNAQEKNILTLIRVVVIASLLHAYHTMSKIKMTVIVNLNVKM